MARDVLVSGRVQGVAYRWSSAARARELALTGWVRNLADGRVQALLEGPDDALDAMLAWMERGPPAAAVDALLATDAPAYEGEGFEILPTARGP
jgi:acylphosphatase